MRFTGCTREKRSILSIFYSADSVRWFAADLELVTVASAFTHDEHRFHCGTRRQRSRSDVQLLDRSLRGLFSHTFVLSSCLVLSLPSPLFSLPSLHPIFCINLCGSVAWPPLRLLVRASLAICDPACCGAVSPLVCLFVCVLLMRHSSSALLALPSRARSSPSSPVLSCSLEESLSRPSRAIVRFILPGSPRAIAPLPLQFRSQMRVLG